LHGQQWVHILSKENTSDNLKKISLRNFTEN